MKKFLIIAATLIITSCAIGAGENSRVIGAEMVSSHDFLASI